MHELIDRAGVGLEIPDELGVVTALRERREPELLIKLARLRHLADIERVGSRLVKRHYRILREDRCPGSQPQRGAQSRPSAALRQATDRARSCISSRGSPIVATVRH
jgi:hypothetical protein